MGITYLTVQSKLGDVNIPVPRPVCTNKREKAEFQDVTDKRKYLGASSSEVGQVLGLSSEFYYSRRTDVTVTPSLYIGM